MIYESRRILHSGFWKHLFLVRVFPGFGNQFNVEEAPVWFDGRSRIHNGARLMHEFDVTIKLLLLRAAKLTVRELTGTDIGSGCMSNCLMCKTGASISSVKRSTAASFPSSCRAGMTRRCRCAWPNTALQSI